MSSVAWEVIAAFDALPDTEREAVAAELLARHPAGAGEFADDDFIELADEVFSILDAAEAQDAIPSC